MRGLTMRAVHVAANLGHGVVEVFVERNSRFSQDFASLGQPVTCKPGDDGYRERGNFFQRNDKQPGELAHIGDASEDVDEQNLQLRRRGEPLQNRYEPRRLTAEAARAYVQKVVGPQS